MFQRLDAADTMVEMGILSRDQMLESLGLGDFQLRCIRMDGPAIVCNGPVGRDQRFDPWTNFFSTAPMMRANTLGQLLDGVKKHFSLEHFDTGDILLVLIILFLYLEDGDNLELVITLGLLLLLGLEDEKAQE